MSMDFLGGPLIKTGLVMQRLSEKLLSRVRLCNPMDCSPPDSSVHGILQARTLEWVAMSSSRGSSQPRILASPALAGRFFTTEPVKHVHFHLKKVRFKQRVPVWKNYRDSDQLLQ